jgi:hypothetical protein
VDGVTFGLIVGAAVALVVAAVAFIKWFTGLAPR